MMLRTRHVARAVIGLLIAQLASGPNFGCFRRESAVEKDILGASKDHSFRGCPTFSYGTGTNTRSTTTTLILCRSR